ncbi:MAG TPA: biotin/lipoyl-containing protein, partial [Intrasporangium sp.]|nr:biotin/lipoyl-containing protein [Intrasporangium sp.]
MAIRTFKLPDPGEGLVEAEIVEWKVAPGDTVKVNDMVLEVETAKSLVELPIPWAGTVKDLLVEVGDTVDVGTPIITIDDGQGGDEEPAAPAADTAAPDKADQQEAILVGYGAKAGATARRARKQAAPSGAVSQPTSARESAPTETEQVAEHEPIAEEAVRTPRTEAPAPAVASVAPVAREGRPRAKPPVRKLAKDLGVDLWSVQGSGADGIITREDVQSFAGGAVQPVAEPAALGVNGAAAASPAAYAPFGFVEREERIPIKGVRKMTAQAMVGSAFTAPHVTEWVTVDVTKTMELVDRLKASREFREVKVTPLLVLAKAMVLAIRRNPGV